MSMKFLGEEFDIHGGGLDLIFPHHENEIAQSAGATGKSFAKTWVHNGFVTVNKEKMSKSLGNFFTLKDIFAKYDPMVVRYFLLSQHYRGPLNFSDQELDVAKKTWTERVCGAYEAAGKPSIQKAVLPPEFQSAMLDDLNTAGAFGVLNIVCSEIFQIVSKKQPVPAEKAAQLAGMLDVLGLRPATEENWAPELVALAHERDAARNRKDWKRSDEIRDALKQKGVLVEDTPSGPKLKRI
jgi:cysteinyl-tRNA synthetase